MVTDMRRYILAAIVVGVVVAVSYFAYSTRSASLSNDEWDICEAVLRHQIFNSAAGGRGTATAYVSILGLNPSSEFLKRFVGHRPPVRPGSQFVEGWGVLYSIHEIRRTGDKSAEVSGGYYEGNLSSSGNTYYLIRQDGKWIVERDRMHWISAAPSRSVLSTLVRRTAILRRTNAVASAIPWV